MNNIELIKDYKENNTLRASFNHLAKETFGMSFEPWYQNGFWNDAYICYSFKVEDRIISNVSINKMKLKWDNKDYTAIQIGTVMTTPEYRKKGLASHLLETIVKEWENEVDFIYLFGNDDALDLYKKFKMVEFNEHQFFTTLPNQKQSDLRKLNLSDDNDYKLMLDMSQRRVAQFEAIGVESDSHLVMFYCHKIFADKLYYLESKKTIVVMEEDEILHIYDVISNEVQDMDELLTLLSIKNEGKVEFHFKPVMRQLTLEETLLVIEDQTLLIRHKDIEPKETFRFPEFSHA